MCLTLRVFRINRSKRTKHHKNRNPTKALPPPHNQPVAGTNPFWAHVLVVLFVYSNKQEHPSMALDTPAHSQRVSTDCVVL